MLLEVAMIEGVNVVTLRVAQLSRRNCKHLKESMAAAVDFRRQLIIDLGSAEYFDASGLSLLIYWLAECHRMGGSVVMCSDSHRLRALIELVRISACTTVCSSLDEALDASCQIASMANSGDQSTQTRIRSVRAAAAG